MTTYLQLNWFFHSLSGLIRFLALKAIYTRNLVTDGLSIVESGGMIRIFRPGFIKLGARSRIYSHAKIISKGSLIIGKRLHLNDYSRIVAHESIQIGDNVTIAQFVTILDHDHDFHLERGNMVLSGYITRPIKIGSNVWLGDKVTILKGVNIGDNVIIGANSLVHRDIPSNSIAAGCPARVIRSI